MTKFTDRDDALALKIRSRLILWIGHLSHDRPTIEQMIDEIDDLAREFVVESKRGTIEETIDELGQIYEFARGARGR